MTVPAPRPDEGDTGESGALPYVTTRRLVDGLFAIVEDARVVDDVLAFLGLELVDVPLGARYHSARCATLRGPWACDCLAIAGDVYRLNLPRPAAREDDREAAIYEPCGEHDGCNYRAVRLTSETTGERCWFCNKCGYTAPLSGRSDDRD